MNVYMLFIISFIFFLICFGAFAWACRPDKLLTGIAFMYGVKRGQLSNKELRQKVLLIIHSTQLIFNRASIDIIASDLKIEITSTSHFRETVCIEVDAPMYKMIQLSEHLIPLKPIAIGEIKIINSDGLELTF